MAAHGVSHGSSRFLAQLITTYGMIVVVGVGGIGVVDKS